LARLHDCAAIQHLAATFMREVAAGHLSVVRILCCILHWCGHHLQSHLSLARLRSEPCLCIQTSSRRWATRAGAGVSFLGIILPGVSPGLCLVSALGCHLHERGRGWPLFSCRGADDLQPILVTCTSRGNEARIWSGHHLQNDLCLARLKSAPRLCTLTPRGAGRASLIFCGICHGVAV